MFYMIYFAYPVFPCIFQNHASILQAFHVFSAQCSIIIRTLLHFSELTQVALGGFSNILNQNHWKKKLYTLDKDEQGLDIFLMYY